MLRWKVLGSCLYNVQYEIHLENTINLMQGWQKQKLLLFVLARGFKQERKKLENKAYLFLVETNTSYTHIIIWEKALFFFLFFMFICYTKMSTGVAFSILLKMLCKLYNVGHGKH